MSELYLIHFNHNHDPKTGRFARAFGSFISSGKLSEAEKEDQKTAAELAGYNKTMAAYNENVRFNNVNRADKSFGEISKHTSDATRELSKLISKPKPRNMRKLRKQMASMDNETLDATIKRLKLEDQYMNLVGKPTTSRGRQALGNAVSNIGTLTKVGASAASTAFAVYKFTHWYF